jgi:hypothetical protein
MPWWDDVVQQTEKELEELDHLEDVRQAQAPLLPDPTQAAGSPAEGSPGGSSPDWSGQVVDAGHRVQSDVASVSRYETDAAEAGQAAAEAHSQAEADAEMGYREQDPERAAEYFEAAAAREREAQELEWQAQQADRQAAEARRWESWDRMSERDLVERQRMAVEHQSGYDYQQAKAEGDRVMHEAREGLVERSWQDIMPGQAVPGGPLDEPAGWDSPVGQYGLRSSGVGVEAGGNSNSSSWPNPLEDETWVFGEDSLVDENVDAHGDCLGDAAAD